MANPLFPHGLVQQSRKIVRFVPIAMISMLSGCADIPYETADLVPPSKRCMTAPASLPKLKEGDDLVKSYALVTRSYGREVSKLKCLQRWTHTVLNK